MPETEFRELAKMYERKGLSRETAKKVAQELTEHDALAAHADIEFGIDPENLTNAWHAAFASMVAFTIGGPAAAARDHADPARRPGLGDGRHRGARAGRGRRRSRPGSASARVRPGGRPQRRRRPARDDRHLRRREPGRPARLTCGCSSAWCRRRRWSSTSTSSWTYAAAAGAFRWVTDRAAARHRWRSSPTSPIARSTTSSSGSPAPRPSYGVRDGGRRRRRLPERRRGPASSGPASTSTTTAAPSSTRLATGARAAANRAGVPVDGQRFRPHVTARPARPPAGGDAAGSGCSTPTADPPGPSTGSTLVASYLGEGPRGRPRYEPVEEFALSG